MISIKLKQGKMRIVETMNGFIVTTATARTSNDFALRFNDFVTFEGEVWRYIDGAPVCMGVL
jgi:hypothetical protein